jgi:DNA-directed RNA polymerase specialized sigma24 family protein
VSHLQDRRAAWLRRLEASGIGSDDAEDLVQDALLQAFEYLQRQHPDDSPEALESRITDALICCILRRRMVDLHRAKRRELRLFEYLAEHLFLSPDAHERWEIQAAHEVLESLPEFWQAVARWRAEGYSWRQIATETGKPIGTLAVGLERAVVAACARLGYVRRAVG